MRRSLLLCLLSLSCAAEKADGRPWVHNIDLKGVKHVSKKELKSKIAVEETSWIPLAPKHYLDPFALDVDRTRIEAYYAAHGYFSAAVAGTEVKPRDQKNQSVDVEFDVYEGAPTKIVKVSAEGLEPVGEPNAKKIRDDLERSLPAGTPFDHAKYLAKKGEIEGRLKHIGFAWAKVDGAVEVDRSARTADVTYAVTPGTRAQFGDVEVRGAGKEEERLLVRHARVNIHEGKWFDWQVLEDARGRIYNLGVFSSVKVDYEPDATRPDHVKVIITVTKGDLREVRVGGGLDFESTRYDLHLQAQYIQHNFLGGLRTLKLRVQPGWTFLVNPQAIGAPVGGPSNGPSLKSDATFTQPDFIAPYYELKWVVGYDLGIDYAYQYHGPRTTLGVTRSLWNNRVTLGLSYNFNFLMFFNTVPAFESDPHAAAALFGYTNPYRVGWWQQDFALDLRDHPLDPHKGGYLGATVEEGGSYAAGDFSYEKILPQLRLYVPLGSRLTLAARASFGQIYAQGREGSPITRRFFLGGADSHRGFPYNRLSVQVPLGYKGAPNLPIGGDQMLLMTAELRLDLFRLYGNWFGVAGFVDAGDVAAPNGAGGENLGAVLSQVNNGYGICYDGSTPKLPTSIDMSRLHTAVGGGLRYHTVIGTVRFDLGVRLNRLANCEPDHQPNPDPGGRIAFHISIGESF